MPGDNIICPICHNDYEDPRILPCGHAVCHDCLQGLLDKDEPSWECPECSTMYIAVDGAKSFPKSKYLLGVMKRGTPTPQNKVRIEKCKFHPDNDVSIYCRNERCKVLICQSCYFDEHKTHDAIEIKKEEKKKLKDLHEKLESAAEKLQLRKEKIFATKIEVAEKNKICLKTLNETKNKILKAVENQMDELTKDATNQISEVNEQFDDDLNDIEELLTEVESLKESARSQSVTYDDLVDK